MQPPLVSRWNAIALHVATVSELKLPGIAAGSVIETSSSASSAATCTANPSVEPSSVGQVAGDASVSAKLPVSSAVQLAGGASSIAVAWPPQPASTRAN